MMELTKGMKIRQTRENKNPLFANTTANETLVFEVTRVNKKTYGLKCIEGYMKNMQCKLLKDFGVTSKDEYGTITKWEIVA